MKYHKITGVDKQVCTAEQMVAYNFAKADFQFAEQYKRCPTAIARGDFADERCNHALKVWNDVYAEKSPYNVDAIFSALRAGYDKFMMDGAPILREYGDVGKYFPALYLNQ